MARRLVIPILLAGLACNRAGPAEQRPDARHGQQESSRAAATPAGNAAPPGKEACALAISDASVWLLGLEKPAGRVERVQVAGVFFASKPEQGTDAMVVPYPLGEAVRLKVEGASRDETAGPWLVRLSDGVRTALSGLPPQPDRRPEAPSDAVVLWPAPEREPRVLPATSGSLPQGVAVSTVKAALDLEGDGAADILIVEFCCGQRDRRLDCEYSCGETWQRVGESWMLCRAWQPA